MERFNLLFSGISLIVIFIFSVYLSFKTKFYQLKGLKNAFKNLKFKSQKRNANKGLSSNQAMFTSLAATIGTGNIVGVSGAISLCGAGVIFWLFITSVFSMIIKYFEIHISFFYREKTDGEYKGGIMYVVKNVLPQKFKIFGTMFALFTVIASFGTGNLIQMDTATESFKNILPTSFKNSNETVIIFAVALSLAVGFMLLSGVNTVGKICEKTVPIMLLMYVLAAGYIIILNFKEIPNVITRIIVGAFNPKAVTGGTVASMLFVAKTGVSRSIISNEAGLGTASLTHSATNNSDISSEANFGILEVFIDGFICILTGIIILLSRIDIPYGKDLGLMAINECLYIYYGKSAYFLLSLFLLLFAISSVLGWGAYGICAAEFLCGKKGAFIYKMIFSAACLLSVVISTQKIWIISELFNSLMALPNILVLGILSKRVISDISDFN